MCCLDAGPIETTPRTRTKASLGGKVASSPARTRQRNRSAARAPLTAARRSGRDRMAQAGSGGNTHRHRLHREFGELDKHNCPARSDLVPPRACGFPRACARARGFPSHRFPLSPARACRFPLALARGPAVSPLSLLPLALAGSPREGPRFPLSGFPSRLREGPNRAAAVAAVSPLNGAFPLALAGFPSRLREGPRFPLSTALLPSRLQVSPRACARARGFPSQQRSSPRARARAPTVPPSRPSCFLLAAFARFPSVWQVFLFFIGSPLALARGPQPCRRCRRGFPSHRRSSPRARARAPTVPPLSPRFPLSTALFPSRSREGYPPVREDGAHVHFFGAAFAGAAFTAEAGFAAPGAGAGGGGVSSASHALANCTVTSVGSLPFR
jgi:hypothetical protein